jgi:hypothetical protein
MHIHLLFRYDSHKVPNVLLFLVIGIRVNALQILSLIIGCYKM